MTKFFERDRVFTVWKFQDFAVTQILREINFAESKSSKLTFYSFFFRLDNEAKWAAWVRVCTGVLAICTTYNFSVTFHAIEILFDTTLERWGFKRLRKITVWNLRHFLPVKFFLKSIQSSVFWRPGMVKNWFHVRNEWQKSHQISTLWNNNFSTIYNWFHEIFRFIDFQPFWPHYTHF